MLLGFPGILLIFKFSEEFFDWIIDAVNGKYCYLETCIEPRCKFQTHKSVKVENHIERKIIFLWFVWMWMDIYNEIVDVSVGGFHQICFVNWYCGSTRYRAPPTVQDPNTMWIY